MKKRKKTALRNELVKEEKSFLRRLDDKIGKLANSIERTRIDEYTSMVTKPWKFFFFNFVVGIFRGVGIAIGMTMIFALIIYIVGNILVRMVDLPIIGMYIAELVKFVNQYTNGIPGR
ncbi:MAG: DUF5665 domain-containing protein [Candidatus Margulisiibacteriota bacterium]|nr:DUF5665 domain-containing protein [Candidatus Margulisiibacteriota bacterium]